MTLRFLLDTNIVSAPIAKQPNARLVARIEQEAAECAIGAPVWHELTYGVLRLPRGKRSDALMTYVEEVVARSFPVLPYDDSAARWHARERVRLEKKGLAAPFVDGQIAAIAKTNGLILVTLNPRDFARYEGLDVETWSTAR